jgi:NAD(P)-dependent dehydrogenase (short-subunit alcohol dehydrogenase family)
MPSLSGQRALIVGAGCPFAELLRAALADAGATVDAVPAGADPSIHPEVGILVTCPPHLIAGAGLADALATAVTPANTWATHFAARRQEAGGVIVHVTGLAGLGGWPGWDAAGVAYAALHSLTRSTAVALAPRGIRVNALVPGVDEPLAREIAAASGSTPDEVRDRIPSRRFMTDTELANALIYLVHPSSSYVSGETLVVDGGWDIWGRLAAAAAS